MARKQTKNTTLMLLFLCLSMLAFSTRIAAAKPTLIGDVNHDHIVDVRDLYALALAFGSTPDSARWNASADLNNDGRIDTKDIYIVCRHFGT